MDQFLNPLLAVVAILTVGCVITLYRAKQIAVHNDYALQSESTESQFVASFLQDKIKRQLWLMLVRAQKLRFGLCLDMEVCCT